jgi:hypothetical protein
LYDALKGDGISEADKSYGQTLDRLGNTREEAAARIQSMPKVDLKLEKVGIQNAIDIQERDLKETRDKFLSTFQISIDEMRNVVALGFRNEGDKNSEEFYRDAEKTVQNFDALKSGNGTVSQFAENLSMLDKMPTEAQVKVSEASFAERRALGRLENLKELSGLVAANLVNGERAAQSMSAAFTNAAEDAKPLAAAVAQLPSSVAAEHAKPLAASAAQPFPSIATEDATLLGGAIAQPSSSIGGFLMPVDIDGATIRQTPGAGGSGSSGCVPTIETHRPAQAGLEAVQTKSDEQNKKADEDATARQKELAGAITAVGDVFTNGIKGAKDFNDALDSIGLGLLDLAAKGLFGQGALGGVFNQLLGAGSGGAGLLSLLAGSSDGSSGGGLFSGIGSLFGNLFGGLFGGGRASGGQVLPGQLYEVGEVGREWFAPSVPGQVIPNHVIKGAAGGGGASQPITFNISMAGANGDRTIAAIAAAAVKNGLASVPEINRQHRIRFA